MNKLHAIGVAFTLGSLLALSSAALAEDGPSARASTNADDPGIAALHQATDSFREARAAIRANCTGHLDKTARELCRTERTAAHDAFKASREAAKAKHHAFRDAQKAAHGKGKPDAAPAAPAKP